MNDLSDEQRAAARQRRARIRACPHCDELGWQEHPDGTVSRCTHPNNQD